MEIEILGVGCSKCKQLTANAEAAVKELNICAEVSKVTDINTMIEKGVIQTPALIVNGKIIVQGKIPTVEQLKAIIQREVPINHT